MKVQLVKVHGSGNTFYLYEALYDDKLDYVNMAKQLCNPSINGGADGLLLVLPSDIADAKMRVINADGSEASMCGNGLRCVARHVCEKLEVDEAIIETMHACLTVRKEAPIFEQLPTYSVEISPISFELSSLPMFLEEKQELHHERIEAFSEDIPFTAVSVPNPHLIGIVEKKYIENTSHQQQLAAFLNSDNEYCPNGVNVSYVLPISNDEIFVRTYERGVGFTNACGTAMTASALISTMENIVSGNLITVYNPGGFVQCSVEQYNDKWKLSLIGNATIVGYYEIEYSHNKIEFTDCVITEEQVQYDKCNIYTENRLRSFTQ
ncbi:MULTISPECIES: diaminopimelate epimerase [unclassified Solibacillus]|uniref:diaminopimelate epimerase n=1 Tax=unclassified Solibacillus TaxID=2637870 RepID=UPI0030F98DD0